jgi:hypothetical protein
MLSPSPASATLPDSSAPTMILLTLLVVLMILVRSMSPRVVPVALCGSD